MSDYAASRRTFVAGAAIAAAANVSALAQDGSKQPGAPTAPKALD